MRKDLLSTLKSRMLDIVIDARNAAISETVKVKRILPFRLRKMEGPFIFMDHAGPIAEIQSNPSTLDVLPHLYIGLFTEAMFCRTGNTSR